MFEDIKPVGPVRGWEEPNLLQCYPVPFEPCSWNELSVKLKPSIAQKEPTGAVQSRARNEIIIKQHRESGIQLA